MIVTKMLVNMSIASHSYLCMCVGRTFKIYSQQLPSMQGSPLNSSHHAGVLASLDSFTLQLEACTLGPPAPIPLVTASLLSISVSFLLLLRLLLLILLLLLLFFLLFLLLFVF